MNHKSYIPDEATLMAYLYDELDGVTRTKVAHYLKENPAVQAEIEGMQSARDIMGMLGDQDAGQPLILIGDEKNDEVGGAIVQPTPIVATTPKTQLITIGFARTMIGIAAAIVLVFLMGALTDLKIQSGTQGLAISFGDTQTPPQDKTKQTPTIIKQGIDKSEVKKLLSSYMQHYGDSLSQKLGGLEQKLVLQNRRILNTQKKNVVNDNQGFTVTEVQMMVDNLKKENLKTMVELIRLSNKDQKDYVGRAIADYSRFVEDQRESDLKQINLNISSLDDRTKTKQLQSDRLLAKVMEQVNRKKDKNSKR